MKVCPKCQRRRPASAFYRTRSGGLTRVCRDCRREECRARYAARHREPLRLSAEPFRAWLLEQLAGIRADLAKTEDARGRPLRGKHLERQARAVLRDRVGVSIWSIDEYLDGRRRSVHIDTVDAALLREGRTLLQEIYPDLYEFDQQEAA